MYLGSDASNGVCSIYRSFLEEVVTVLLQGVQAVRKSAIYPEH